MKPKANSYPQDIAASYRGKVDVVVGLDARGFLYAPIMAAELGLPFVPESLCAPQVTCSM